MTPPKLINASGKPVHVLVDGQLVPLPEIALVTVVTRNEDEDRQLYAVGDGTCELSVGAGVPDITLGLSAESEGTIYLVTKSVLTRMPFRRDLITIGAYRLIASPERNASGEPEQVEFALVTAHRALPPAKAPLADINLRDLMYDEDLKDAEQASIVRDPADLPPGVHEEGPAAHDRPGGAR